MVNGISDIWMDARAMEFSKLKKLLKVLYSTCFFDLTYSLTAGCQRSSYLVPQIDYRWSCTITEKAPTRAFSWLKALTSAYTFKTLLRHYAKQMLTPRSLNVKLGPRRNYHEVHAAIRHYTNQPARPLWPLRRGPNFTLRDRGVNARLA